jgi:hypothetical protein
MTLERITSLADLVFKAKTNKYYKQLAIISARHLDISEHPETYEQAIIIIAKVTLKHNPDSCSDVVDAINSYRYDVKEDRPAPKNKTRWYDDCVYQNAWNNSNTFNNRYYTTFTIGEDDS